MSTIQIHAHVHSGSQVNVLPIDLKPTNCMQRIRFEVGRHLNIPYSSLRLVLADGTPIVNMYTLISAYSDVSKIDVYID